jgi:hypothetical protein
MSLKVVSPPQKSEPWLRASGRKKQEYDSFTIDGVELTYNEYGMIKQKNPAPFDYSKPYLEQQSTNLEMSYLRLGYLLSTVPYENLKKASALELGPGTGNFFEVVKNHVKSIDGFDIADSKYSTVSLKEAQSRKWDIVFGFDVLEHFHDIDDLWKIDFTYGYFSSPCPPVKGIFKEWRHWKPNEHIYHITMQQFVNWVADHDYELLGYGHPEDLLRKRWDEKQANINSFVIMKKYR